MVYNYKMLPKLCSPTNKISKLLIFKVHFKLQPKTKIFSIIRLFQLPVRVYYSWLYLTHFVMLKKTHFTDFPPNIQCRNT